MKLVKAKITYYRSIEDSGEFDIEDDVTGLVGKNESGKTNILRTLFRVNPIETAVFDEIVDFPASLVGRKRRDFPDGKRIPIVTATFRYEDHEVAEIEEDLGAKALKSPTVIVEKYFRSTSTPYTHDLDESVIVAHLLSGIELTQSAAAEVKAATTVKSLMTALRALDEPPTAITDLVKRIEEWRDESVTEYVIDEYDSRFEPRFVYFGDYDTMPGKVSIPDLIRRAAEGTLKRGEKALISLLDMAGVGLEDFKNADNHERLIRELENTSNAISQEVFEYWSQNTNLRVQLQVLQPEVNAPAPLDVGPILQIRVWNDRHGVSVPFDDRSRGFVWFFSFLAYFNKLEEGDRDLILLLDEPGLSLHGRAQDDLLTLIDERLAPQHQVIYTTHSPFMISSKHLERIRTVIDHEKGGTKVSAEIFRADSDTAFPLLAAMGIEMTQTLFVADDTLLVEGPSDLIYLDVFSDAADDAGRTTLDPLWVITPIGGSGMLSTFATLLGANKVNVAVLIDSSTKDVGAVKRLRENNQLALNGLVEVSEFTTANDADIEDLLDRAFYIDLVNRAYTGKLSAPITAADLNGSDPRIVRQIESYFRQHNIDGGRFNHLKPARALLRQQAELPAMSTATLDRIDKLFTRINALIRERR